MNQYHQQHDEMHWIIFNCHENPRIICFWINKFPASDDNIPNIYDI